MQTVLWLIPALPLAGFLILAMLGRRLPRPWVSFTGVGSVAGSAIFSLWAAVAFIRHMPERTVYTRTLWTWFDAGGLHAGISFYLDALAVTMIVVITGVGFLIHVYSTGYMREDDGYSRFFAYLNLFVACMLTLVLADNLLLLYLGWEGVGLCSYLLIGFWYTDPANGRAARKAFIVTRVGDTAMAVGLFLLFTQLGTLQLQTLLHQAAGVWTTGALLPTVAAFLLLGGAMGKSAQLPLQTWLPDAMAGPTPVSALIHAATMVTAGVYLIARMHALFELAPTAMRAVALVGAATLLVAGFSALCQRRIKRVLAYSTISQIGYMFLALGVGAWGAAMFHLVTHAFFKALLFLGAGGIMHALGGEQDMFKMGGLRREIPLIYITFLSGCASLAAVPLITAGFYSKDLIIWETLAAQKGGIGLWVAALVGALLTALYTFRMFLLVFEGRQHTAVSHKPGWRMNVPLLILMVFTLTAGFIETPRSLGGVHLFSNFIQSALPAPVHLAAPQVAEPVSQILSVLLVLVGIGIIWWLIQRAPALAHRMAASPWGAALQRLGFTGWGFDALYNTLLVRPYIFVARINRGDIIDRCFDLTARGATGLYRWASASQTGRLRHYVAGMGLGAVALIALMVWL